MFNKFLTKELVDEIMYLRTQIPQIQKDIYELRIKTSEQNDLVECEKCGCLLRKKTAIYGGDKIVEVTKMEQTPMGMCYPKTVKEVQGKYYCKVHAPKKKDK